MTDEHLTHSPSAPPPPTEADYEAIAAAVMGTVRGRWFLAEFAKRNRNADTALILERIDRIEKLLHTPPAAVSPAERVRIDLVEMAKAIARTRSEIAAIRPDGDAKGTLSEASEELGSVVKATERATSDILATAEQIQETAWMLRERGADSAICDALDQRATDIYSACSFQDLTGQRIRKVVDVLQFLEDRIRSMIEIWGGAVPDEDGTPAVAAPHVGEDRTVPHLAQQDIDRMMPSAPPDGPAAEADQRAHDVAAGARGPARRTQPGAGAEPGIAASAAPGPDSGIARADVARAAATAGPAEPVRAAETGMTPAMAIVGATALAIDLLPTAIVRPPEPVPQAEAQPEPTAEVEVEARAEVQVQAEPETEAQVEAQAPVEPAADAQVEPEVEAQVEAQAEAAARPEPEPEPRAEPAFRSEPAAADAPPEAAHPAPPPEPISEQTPESEAEAAPSEVRADPAAVLERILAIIRAPNDPAAGSITEDVSPVAATRPAEPEPDAGVTAAISILAPAVAQIVAGPGPAADVHSVDVVAADHAPAELSAAPPGDAVAVRTAEDVIEETADKVRTPPTGRLTVDQAVDAMLKAPGRVDVRPTHAPAGAATPVEAPNPGETRAVAAEPVDPGAEPAAAAVSRSPFVIEAPEFTVTTRAPVPAAPAAEAAPVAETVATHLAPPHEPAPRAVADELGAPPAAEATVPDTAPAEEPPVEPVTAALAPLVSPAPPGVTDSEPPAPDAPAAPAADPARPAPRHPALAAITALSDEEKIALFS